jgi:hypothetical protein
MPDVFQGPHYGGVIGPATGAAAVTPSNTVALPGGVCRGLYVGGAGDVAAVLADQGAAVTFVAVPAGTFMPVRVFRVNSTGTTATNLVALY